ncbi:hypothetical protein HETIRDRAFT_476057 [Heterobasidion irregulare TC 32-1]|uniref:Uncharacterized protein n=1 Tax=Heterobasidion irregulare (strain TC 32-1) TaxID=747525 RepID=W4K3R0_HETIT|nr:uncharacterized protein HETIRDRAFT_476057 [Heterobasidion irregulare TC 32-1]ETW80447.1 hypothetical protein HETIRDRAFT_476057 [Heterobasidion irregulare TC 32-1]
MELEPGDEYLRRLATFIHTNEHRLAEAGFHRRRRSAKPTPASGSSVFNPLSWFAADAGAQVPTNSPKPLAFSIDTHRLFYVLMRLEAQGFDVGSLDIKVDSPSRPMNYVNIFSGTDRAETMSLSSIRSSLSVVSRLSLGVGWWGRPEIPSLDQELRYLFSSFTKIPALSLSAPGPKKIAELANDSPSENALPLDAFKNLQSLECTDIDPRTLLGWDRLADSLWSLTIKKSGLDDVSDVLIGAVLDDQARRQGTETSRRKNITHGPSRQSSFHSTRLPEAISEDSEDAEDEGTVLPPSPPKLSAPQLSSSKWALLRYLSLADNSLTFIPMTPLPYLTSVTHLDLSSNLLVSVPPGLSTLYNLVSLNLSDNMIDSVLGIYKQLGQILTLNLSHNRLESICGLERLMGLERVDIRNNAIEETAEVGRLSTLPNIAEVWVEGNPFIELEEGYRVKCFDLFWKEGKNILLDGTAAGFYEKRNFTTAPPQQMTSARPVSKAYSPPVVPVRAAASPALSYTNGASSSSSPTFPPSSSSRNASPYFAAAVVGKSKRKKVKRIVDLGDARTDDSTADRTPDRPVEFTEDGGHASFQHPGPETTLPPPSFKPADLGTLTKTRHRRSQTEHTFAAGLDPTQLPAKSRIDRTGSLRAHKSAMRRARVNASAYEAPGVTTEAGAVGDEFKDVDAFRARIEALRSDMGDGWLKVFSQSQLGRAAIPSG